MSPENENKKDDTDWLNDDSAWGDPEDDTGAHPEKEDEIWKTQQRARDRERKRDYRDSSFRSLVKAKFDSIVAPSASPDFGDAVPILAKETPEWPTFEFMCKELGIVPGPPTLLIGYGFSGKTFFAQTLILCVATGTKLFGRFDIKRGVAIHLDYEQGAIQSRIRYNRLIYGMKINPGAIRDGDLLYYAPKAKLNEKGADEELGLILAGKTVCVIDSLRAAISSGIDENSAGIRDALDMLGRVSEDTRCAIIVLHHTGKSKLQDDRFAARGSSAIFDAAGMVLNLNANVAKGSDKATVYELAQSKTRTVRFSGIHYQLIDSGDYVDAIGMSEGIDLKPISRDAKSLRFRILDALKSGEAGAMALAEKVGGNKEDYGLALRALVDDDAWITERTDANDGRRKFYRITEEAEENAALKRWLGWVVADTVPKSPPKETR